MIDTNKKDLSNKDKTSDERHSSQSSKFTNRGLDTSTLPQKIAGFLKLTDKLRTDAIVNSFHFYDRNDHFEIVLELNEKYLKRKFVFITGKGWDRLLRSIYIQLEHCKIKYDHILHILDTLDRNDDLFLNYQLERSMFDSFSYEDVNMNRRNNSKSFEFSNQSFTLDPYYHIIKKYFIDLIVRKYTFVRKNKVYNTILDQHDNKNDPIIIKLEDTKGNEKIKWIINSYDKPTQQLIFKQIILDEYKRDLKDYSLRIERGLDDGCQD